MAFVAGSENLESGIKINAEESQCFEMEVESCETGTLGVSNESVVFPSENGEGSNGNVVFSRESPLVRKDFRSSAVVGGCNCGVNKLKARLSSSDGENGKNEISGAEKKLNRQERIELGRLFQGAVSCHDWELAESLILLADPQTLNDALCIALDSVWFLSTQQELYGITGLIKKIISNGAFDFTRAALRTSFLASCVSACQSRTMSLTDTVTVMARRSEILHVPSIHHLCD